METPALFDTEMPSKLSCTVRCAEVPGCDVVAYNESAKQCMGHASILISNTAPNQFWNVGYTATISTTSSPTANATVIMKRVCAGDNYTFVAYLNWCVQLVTNPKSSWSGAKTVCQGNGGQLAVLDTFDKYTYVKTNFIGIYFTERLWVAGSLKDGLWYFPSTGEVFNQSLNDWHQVFNDLTGTGSCLSFFRLQFYSANCDSLYPFLCEEVW
ncbi:uncharacterized protein LOC117333854 [Pecten maximus]|uniref:uncharacterized protein LOC117333854 n=1 Tax=Pecten maximus TaxID=6579 RepID=UPI0014590C64|nr:uncharacterized protein LOC117333854 [Pecten maximus]